ncbi:hypothetical protein Sru01_01910 [Sphaerisporangium rufum]|uniref:non-specific serine/threonine protein kinase n=1 Tax=Sphaerisporangium rufum TaxID=1381558 RepID=A0A919UWV0_9ACTN|nr:hypothetical protein Sru01_01910 [Sphaerisporangium rufum]
MLTRRYRLVEQIATGGMSAIWRAFDQSLHRTVAIKVLDGCMSDHGGRDLIRREARATARLIHPDAIEVYDYGETVTDRGRLAAYVVMRLLDGRPLSERIDEGPLPWREAATIGLTVAKVLAAAHQRGIVHRDVTAENVLLTLEGPKLLDFGIAAFVGEQVDQRLADYGTPPYVAPERLTGAAAHPAVDVYALGVLIFEMLTGAPPYPETTWEAVESACRTGPPPVPADVPGLPPEISELCAGCLAHEPGARPSAQHVADVLTAALREPETPAGPSPWARRARIVTVAAAVLTSWSALLLWLQPDFSAPVVAAFDSYPPATPMPSAGGPSTPGEPGPRETGGAASRASAEPVADRPERERSQPTVTVTAPAPQAVTPPEAGKPKKFSAGDAGPAVRRSPRAAPAATALPSLDQAVGRFNAALRAGESTGDIRPDVALDLHQVLRNTLRDSSVDPVQGLDDVRGKVATRFEEGALSAGARTELEQELRLISTILQKTA